MNYINTIKNKLWFVYLVIGTTCAHLSSRLKSLTLQLWTWYQTYLYRQMIIDGKYGYYSFLNSPVNTFQTITPINANKTSKAQNPTIDLTLIHDLFTTPSPFPPGLAYTKSVMRNYLSSKWPQCCLVLCSTFGYELGNIFPLTKPWLLVALGTRS